MSHPELDAEQASLDRAYASLDRMRERCALTAGATDDEIAAALCLALEHPPKDGLGRREPPEVLVPTLESASTFEPSRARRVPSGPSIRDRCLVHASQRRHPSERNEMSVDGFVVAVPKDRLAEYKKIARRAGEVWMEHGALSYVECVEDDVPVGKVTSFKKAVNLKRGETVIFSWITYRSRRHRDAVNKKVLADPRLQQGRESMPFDASRMIYGGFKSAIEL